MPASQSSVTFQQATSQKLHFQLGLCPIPFGKLYASLRVGEGPLNFRVAWGLVKP